MNYELLFLYIISLTIFMLTPAPILVLVINNAVHSLKKAFYFILGTNLASIILITFALLAMFGVFKISNDLLAFLSFLGAIFILILGAILLKNDIKKNEFLKGISNAKNSHKNAFISGFSITISNPKDIVFFMAFFPQFSAISNKAEITFIIIISIWAILDFIILAMFAFFARSRFIIKYAKIITLLSDITLIIIGILGIFSHGREFFA